jgi:alkylation response protein AidB-like acyl-CoA dehydrogenase
MGIPGFKMSEEHALLRNQARRWLAQRSSRDAVRRLGEDARGDDPQAWQELAGLGWIGLVIPEAYGGAGLGLSHLAVLLEESGRRLLASPLLPQTLAALVIADGGSDAQKRDWLPRLATGEVVATLAHVEPAGGWTFDETSVVRANRRLNGIKHHVWAAATASLLLVPFQERDATRVALVDATSRGVEVELELGLDRTRRSGRVRLRDVEVSDDRVLDGAGASIFERLLPAACVALAAEMIGGADALLEMTAEYARTRMQFGKPIGSFQAVKHPLVNLLIGVEHGRSLVYAAAAALDAGQADGEILARMAKAHASDLYVQAGSRGVQFHGGFGFTIDCDVHFYLRRALASRPAFGDATQHRRWIGAHLAGDSAGLVAHE